MSNLIFADTEELIEPMKQLKRLLPCGEISGKEISLGQFTDALASLMNSPEEAETGVGVMAAGMYDVRGLEPEVLYMGGLMDGSIPSRPDIDLLLPDTVRKKLGLVDMDRHMALQQAIFERLVNSAGEVYLSYPSMDEDKVFLPSVFLSGYDELPFPVSGYLCPSEAMTAGGRDTLTERIREIKLPGTYPKDRVLRVTEIDSYRRCPRRFCIERVLKASPTEITEFELEPMTLGTIVHKAMELLMAEPPGDIGSFSSRAARAMQAALEETETDKYFSGLLMEGFMKTIPAIHELETELYAEGQRVLMREKTIKGEPLEGISLKGKADRIDKNADTGKVSVIDYKTGSTKISGAGIEKRGENIQLALYAAMLRDTGNPPERIGIYSLGDISVNWLPNKTDVKRGKPLDDYIDAALSFLGHTVKDMRAGLFPARPITESVCASCPEVPFCPYQQGTTEEGQDA